MQIYGKDFDDQYVLEEVCSNIRQKRVRIRKQMKREGSKNHVPLAHGLTKESRDKIWESLSNKQYVDNFNKCNVAAHVRTRRIGFMYKLGP